MAKLSKKDQERLSKVEKVADITVIKLDKKTIGVSVKIAKDADLSRIVYAVCDWADKAADFLEKFPNATGETYARSMEPNKQKPS